MFETVVRVEIEDGLSNCHSRFSQVFARRLSILELVPTGRRIISLAGRQVSLLEESY